MTAHLSPDADRARGASEWAHKGLPLDHAWRASVADEPLRRRYPDQDFDDAGWELVHVPGHWQSTPAFAQSEGPLLYRTRFESPEPFGPGADDESRGPRVPGWCSTASSTRAMSGSMVPTSGTRR